MKIELTPEQIAEAVFEGDYPDHARKFNAIGRLLKGNAEDDDKYYRWTRYIIAQVDPEGLQFFRDMSLALKHRDEENAAMEKKT